jgi:hypothetical protein
VTGIVIDASVTFVMVLSRRTNTYVTRTSSTGSNPARSARARVGCIRMEAMSLKKDRFEKKLRTRLERQGQTSAPIGGSRSVTRGTNPVTLQNIEVDLRSPRMLSTKKLVGGDPGTPRDLAAHLKDGLGMIIARRPGFEEMEATIQQWGSKLAATHGKHFNEPCLLKSQGNLLAI